MMVSLFSVFDTHPWGLSWIIGLSCLALTPPLKSCLATPQSMPFMAGLGSFKQHLNSTLLSTQILQHSLILIPSFILISCWNGLGLLPYVFTPSAHISVSLSLGLSLWLSFILLGWLNSPLIMLAGLLPSGTPPILMPFMVLIETISVIIRPLTLAVRLSANMIAGHLLLSLCSGGFSTLGLSLITLMAQTLLFSLEVAVAFIQAYVFVTLVALYSKEVWELSLW